MAPQRGGYVKVIAIFFIFGQLSFVMSPKQHIKTLVASGARNFFDGHRKVVRVGSLYKKCNLRAT